MAEEGAPPIGTRVVMNLSIDRGPFIECAGTVTWVEEDGSLTGTVGYGVEVDDTGDRIVQALIDFADKRDPIVRDD